MKRMMVSLSIATAFVVGLLLGGWVLVKSTEALLLASVAAVVFGIIFGVVSEYEHRTEAERERRDRERMRRLHSQHPLSARYGGDRFDVF